ncbi:MAG: phosphate ABC transporter substrate-binding protein [Eubacteriales bacterium]|nr:phosphate ABC transporter substrate-binding protein [Eubacteriales bacterium]
MKKNVMKKIVAVAMTAALAASLGACGGSSSAPATTAATTTAAPAATEAATTAAPAATTADLKGTISLAGSTSMQKLCDALSESFMEVYPDITVTVEYTGSGAGIEALTAGSIDIGNSSRNLKSGETDKGAVENIVAVDGIAVIVDKDQTATELTSEQLASIYKGEITNWSEVGGNDGAIVVIGRENGSGTRSAFEELLDVADACAYAQELDSTGGVLAKVASTPGSIGYISLDKVDATVQAVVLDGAEASEESILAGNYKLSRPFVMATMGAVSEQNDLVKTWFDYIASEDGQAVIKAVGLILPQ